MHSLQSSAGTAVAPHWPPVINVLIQMEGSSVLGVLDRVSCDGSWWIHHARTERFAVVQDGLLKSLRLTHTGASSFFTLSELMAANLRSLLSAYAGLWVFTAPGRCSYRLA
jgi:hypothetical protein